MNMMTSGVRNWQGMRYTAQDGLKLYARRYGPSSGFARPVLCLAGLTRNSRDFHDLASFLSSHPARPRPVYSLDYRGRGKSEFDKDWRNYSPFIEMLDVLDFMTIAGLHDAAVVGTSRGGIIAMMMGVMRPAAIGAVVLNDVGPVIETAGLARIMGYAGKVPLPSDWTEAARLMRDINKRFFPAIDDNQWMDVAHQWFNDDRGQPAPGYDYNLARTLSEIDISKKIPEMWPHFEALKRVPVLVIRGEHSDLLSAKTVGEMSRRHPDMLSVTIHGQGHAPFLKDRFSHKVIYDFLRETDPAWPEGSQ